MTSKFEGPRYQRPAPPEYFARYSGLGLANSTAQLYAMLEHMDDQVRAATQVPHTASAAGQ